MAIWPLLAWSLLHCTNLYSQNVGHGPLEVFEIRKAPIHIQGWVGFLTIIFLSGIYFAKNHKEARYVVLSFIGVVVSKNIIVGIFQVTPLSGLLSVLHLFFWSPILYLSIKNRFFPGHNKIFTIWIGMICATICISFIFDIPSTIAYLTYLFAL
ncbi:MAG: hypothetical protein AB8C84_04420 [Oligoflexales bacterium]